MLISPSAVWIGFGRVPVARARRRRRTLVARTAQECGDFLIDRSLQDEPGSQPAQFRQVLALVAEPVGQHFLDLLFEPNTRGDSRYPSHLA